MPTTRKIVDIPSLGAAGDPPPQGPFVLKESATVKISRLHAAQYVSAINARPAYFNLLDYFYQNTQYITASLTTGSTHKDLYTWACKQFQPRLPFCYTHFSNTLASFRQMVGLPPAQESMAAAV